jgi:hypothetical protein
MTDQKIEQLADLIATTEGHFCERSVLIEVAQQIDALYKPVSTTKEQVVCPKPKSVRLVKGKVVSRTIGKFETESVSFPAAYTEAELKSLVADAHFKAKQQAYREVGEWLYDWVHHLFGNGSSKETGIYQISKVDLDREIKRLKSGKKPEE